MSGHSKWSTIKRKKGALDNKRSKIFTRIIKDLTIAARDGGTDPEGNSKLKTAIQNAKGANMPKDTMERAIKKGSDKDADNLQELTYEGYAAGGIAIFIEATTDNLNRTVADVRSIFNKNEGSLGTNGSLEFLFDRKGVFTFEKSQLTSFDLEELEMQLIDGGLIETEIEEEVIMFYSSFEDFGNFQKKLDELKLDPQNAELQRIPGIRNSVDLEVAKKVLKLLDKLEENDDVQNVFHNLEITGEIEIFLAEE